MRGKKGEMRRRKKKKKENKRMKRSLREEEDRQTGFKGMGIENAGER